MVGAYSRRRAPEAPPRTSDELAVLQQVFLAGRIRFEADYERLRGAWGYGVHDRAWRVFLARVTAQTCQESDVYAAYAEAVRQYWGRELCEHDRISWVARR
jgi:hypothetical protein